jgi:hypothetical protein
VAQFRVHPFDGGVVPYAWGAGIVVVPRGLVLALHDGRVSAAGAAAGLCHASATFGPGSPPAQQRSPYGACRGPSRPAS